MPEQVPARCWLPLQVADEHALHLNPFDWPLHAPLRCWFTRHLALLHAVHTPLTVDDAPLSQLPEVQIGWSTRTGAALR